MNPSRPFLSTALALAVGAPVQAQLSPLTSSAFTHTDPSISPDGRQVAYKVGLERIGMVSLPAGFESTLVSRVQQQDLFDFLWSPSSSGIYYLQGNLVRFISRSGGVSGVVGTLAGISHSLWCVDAAESTVFGTRREGASYHIFALDTGGGFAPKDIVTSVNVLDDVRVDPSGTYILYRSWPGIPFTAKQYYRADVNGQNQTLLHTTDPLDQAQSAVWTDDGQTFAFSMLSQTNFVFQLARVGTLGVELLTEDNLERRSTVSPDSEWILFESHNPKGGITPAVMPSSGGGLVLLSAGQSLRLNGGFLTGGLSMDENNELVAFSAADLDQPGLSEQIYIAPLNREIRIHPRVEVGGDLTVELPVEMNELGAVAFSVGFEAGAPITVPGISGAFELLAGPGEMATALVGFGQGNGPLTSQLTVPNDTALSGLEIYFQGVRLMGSTQGEFTHWGWFTIF